MVAHKTNITTHAFFITQKDLSKTFKFKGTFKYSWTWSIPFYLSRSRICDHSAQIEKHSKYLRNYVAPQYPCE